MAETSRLDDLRRRVGKDPASIAFAQLAEEYRRAGQIHEAVDVCRAGLAIHPGYLSARVTLGRALLELNDLAAARTELEQVLKSAPENLAAIRGLAEIHHRSGNLQQALAQYRAALGLAKNDPDLEQTVAELTRELAPKAAPDAGADRGRAGPECRRSSAVRAAGSAPSTTAPRSPPEPPPGAPSRPSNSSSPPSMSHAPTASLERRHQAVREASAEAALDALVVTSLPNVLYLTNFSGSAAIAVVTRDRLDLRHRLPLRDGGGRDAARLAPLSRPVGQAGRGVRTTRRWSSC